MWHRLSAKHFIQRQSHNISCDVRRTISGSHGCRPDSQLHDTISTETVQHTKAQNVHVDFRSHYLHPCALPQRVTITAPFADTHNGNLLQEDQGRELQTAVDHNSIDLNETELYSPDVIRESYGRIHASYERSESFRGNVTDSEENLERPELNLGSNSNVRTVKVNDAIDSDRVARDQPDIDAGGKQNKQSIKQDNSPKIYDVVLTQETLIEIVKLLQILRELGLPNTVGPLREWKPTTLRVRRVARPVSLSAVRVENKALMIAHQRLTRSYRYQKYYAERLKLPVNQPEYSRNILSQVAQKDVVVLVSETGSGKTTQLPQLLIEDQIVKGEGFHAGVLCTQPRRMAAISVARRVADEQVTKVGLSVGYQVRFLDKNPSGSATISYWTAGVLLRRLHDGADALFDAYSVLIIDEVHERDVTTDLCLTTLRDLIWIRRAARKSCPKVILMSATIDAVQFERYFAEAGRGQRLKVSTIHIPGRNYGVKVHMLDDLVEEFSKYDNDTRAGQLLRDCKAYFEEEDKFVDMLSGSVDRAADAEHNSLKSIKKLKNNADVSESLIALMVAHALKSNDSGDVLVFLPGMREIELILKILQEQPILGCDFTDEHHVRLYRLHGSLYETNDEVFAEIPPGCRRVILATNIAQTSITLPNVVHVVDSGVQRQLTFDCNLDLDTFKGQWINKATSLQRRGRAGRTQPGHYWMAITSERYASLPEKATPEIQLVDLTSATLLVKAQIGDDPVREFLSRMMDAPDMQAVDAAITQLQKLDMFTATASVTALGKMASYFPLSPATTRGLLFGILFRCLRPLLIIACHSLDKPLIASVNNIRDQVRSNVGFAGLTDNDRLAFVEAFDQLDLAHSDIDHNEIEALQLRHVKLSAYNEMLNIGNQVYEQLSTYGVVPKPKSDRGSVFRQIPPELNVHANSQYLINALSMTMKQSKLAVWDQDRERWFAKDNGCYVRPFSVNSRPAMRSAGRAGYERMHGELLSYSSLLHVAGDSMPMLVETSIISPLMAILFGGPVKHIHDGVVELDGWLRIQVNTTKSETDVIEPHEATLLVLELRKALDRFLNMAFSSLGAGLPAATTAAGNTWSESQDFSRLFQSHPLTDALASGLAKILKSDAQGWEEYTHLNPRPRKPGNSLSED